MAYIGSALMAGIGSGALASIVCAPLDLLRTRLQVWGDLHATGRITPLRLWKEIYAIEGVAGYFRGLGATLATVPLFWGLYFPLYHDLKRTLLNLDHGGMLPTNPHYAAALVHCTAAVAAGAVADVVCNPMFVVRTRLQTEAMHTTGKQHNIGQTILTLYQEGGILIFWRGLTASMLGLTHVGLQFPVYEWLKQQARSQRLDGTETPLDLLISSGLAKMCASLLTYPHEVLRSRMMDARHAQEASFYNTMVRIYQHEGLAGFYTGLPISLLRVVPNCCVTFLTYELMLRWSQELYRRGR
jgi:solute carrier family 25 folate transporter 32